MVAGMEMSMGGFFSDRDAPAIMRPPRPLLFVFGRFCLILSA
jgi:hypothetical protein